MGNPIRVLIVDDQPVVRQGLSTVLLAYDDLELVGVASGGNEAVRLSAVLAPDVVLMDLTMPDMDGAVATGVIREANPAIQILTMTSFADQNLVQAALRAGAIGYLLKNISADELVSAIRAARDGKTTVIIRQNRDE